MEVLNNKRIVIVTSSASYESRAEKIGNFFKKNGYEVWWVESDFVHREKRKGREKRKNHFYVDTISYKKNISVRRLYSQFDFARKVGCLLNGKRIDLLYIMIPANSLAAAAVKLKAEQRLTLVLDIIDLWPESLPIKGLMGYWPIEYWRKLRDNNLCKADLVLTECRLYQSILGLEHSKTATLYWPKEQAASSALFHRRDDILHIVYLGSINHIIDMDMILEILTEINRRRKVKLHVIGDGEKRGTFLERLEKSRIDTEYYGIVYDESKKQEIFSRCSFGVNIMKPGVCVGLTMKSIDYFCYGVPLINNIPGDTWQLVDEYGIGINCEKEDCKECAQRIMDAEGEMQEKRGLIQRLYNQLFTVRALEKVLEREVLPLLEKEDC